MHSALPVARRRLSITDQSSRVASGPEAVWSVRVWRIAKVERACSVEDMLNGEGASRYGGRWNPKGMPAVYCSENSSLAALEVLANLVSPSTFPDHRILDLDVPDDAIAVVSVSTGDTRQIGAEMLRTHLAHHRVKLGEPVATQRRDQSGPCGLRQGCSRHDPGLRVRPPAGGIGPAPKHELKLRTVGSYSDCSAATGSMRAADSAG